MRIDGTRLRMGCVRVVISGNCGGGRIRRDVIEYLNEIEDLRVSGSAIQHNTCENK